MLLINEVCFYRDVKIRTFSLPLYKVVICLIDTDTHDINSFRKLLI